MVRMSGGDGSVNSGCECEDECASDESVSGEGVSGE